MEIEKKTGAKHKAHTNRKKEKGGRPTIRNQRKRKRGKTALSIRKRLPCRNSFFSLFGVQLLWAPWLESTFNSVSARKSAKVQKALSFTISIVKIPHRVLSKVILFLSKLNLFTITQSTVISIHHAHLLHSTSEAKKEPACTTLFRVPSGGFV